MEDQDERLPSLYDAWFIIAMVSAVVVSVLLEVSGLEKRMAYAIRPLLPDWFPLFNLLVAPILVALPSMRLKFRISVAPRFFLLVLMLASFSIFRLSLDKHPTLTLLMGIFIYIELFWLIPKWNSRHNATTRLQA